MTPTTHRLVYWAPRLLSVAFALFLGLFALDVLRLHRTATAGRCGRTDVA